MQIESNTKRIAFFFIAECSFILSKDNANRGQYKKNHILFYCRVQLCLWIRKCKSRRFLSFIEDKSKIVPHFIFYKR